MTIRSFKATTLLTAAGVVTAVALAAGTTAAHDRIGKRFDDGSNHPNMAEMKQKHADVAAAITAGDYAKFAELVGDTGPLASITEAQFPKLKEMHEHLDAARTIGDELGLKGPGRHMR